MCSETVLPEVTTVWLEAQTKKGTHDACHVYTHLWLNLTACLGMPRRVACYSTALLNHTCVRQHTVLALVASMERYPSPMSSVKQPQLEFNSDKGRFLFQVAVRDSAYLTKQRHMTGAAHASAGVGA